MAQKRIQMQKCQRRYDFDWTEETRAAAQRLTSVLKGFHYYTDPHDPLPGILRAMVEHRVIQLNRHEVAAALAIPLVQVRRVVKRARLLQEYDQVNE